MPGLIIIFSKNKKIDKGLLSAMADSLQHEEFHKKTVFSAPPFGVARVHLGIFNPESQPLFNEDRSLCIFMEGKIYDYEEEMRNLEKSHSFGSCNDPEFCLHSYEENGINFVKNLNGSFSLIFIHLKEKRAVILTDRYGHRPLYYKEDEDKILFSSEIKAFLKDKNFRRELDREGIADYFIFGEIFGDKTLFKEIRVLPPACIFNYEKGKSSIETYWEFCYAPDYHKKEAELADELVVTFRKAVNMRAKGTARYTISLSGGLDSWSIAAALNEDKKELFTAFTFGPQFCDEVKIGKKAAEKVRIPHEVVEIDSEKLFSVDTMKKLVDITGGMEIVSLSFLLYVYQEMRPSTDVVFQGLAKDLLMGATFLHRRVGQSTSDEELIALLCEQFHVFSPQEMGTLFQAPYDTELADMALASLKENLMKCREEDPRNTSDHFLLLNYVRKFYFVGEILIRNYMEEAVPSHDNDFIDKIMTIPPELRRDHRLYAQYLKIISPGLSRIAYNQTGIRADAPIILWKAARTYLFYKNKRRRILRRVLKLQLKDKGAYIDYAEWFRRDDAWRTFIRETLSSEKVEKRGFFRKEYIEKLLAAHMEGERDNSKKIIYLLTFELFLQVFLDE
ncbi:MAG: hypothetical protein HXS44_10365 [Theionarchaea archaeon]|nr:hypothetical protein [Theionarchaea archaeon]